MKKYQVFIYDDESRCDSPAIFEVRNKVRSEAKGTGTLRHSI